MPVAIVVIVWRDWLPWGGVNMGAVKEGVTGGRLWCSACYALFHILGNLVYLRLRNKSYFALSLASQLLPTFCSVVLELFWDTTF